MKKVIFGVMAAAMLLLTVPAQADEEVVKGTETTVTTEAVAEVGILVNRLEEINAMDFSELTRAEKKELRKEVKSIKKDLKDLSKSDAAAPAAGDANAQGDQGAGLYISGGALIVILLLILLL